MMSPAQPQPWPRPPPCHRLSRTRGTLGIAQSRHCEVPGEDSGVCPRAAPGTPALNTQLLTAGATNRGSPSEAGTESLGFWDGPRWL